MKNRIYVRLKILSNTITPEALTDHIGIECDRSWHIGDKRGKTQILEPSHGWELTSGKNENASLEEHLDGLLVRTSHISSRLAALPQDVVIEVSCAIYSKHPPELCFGANYVQQLATIRAGLDIDLYNT